MSDPVKDALALTKQIGEHLNALRAQERELAEQLDSVRQAIAALEGARGTRPTRSVEPEHLESVLRVLRESPHALIGRQICERTKLSQTIVSRATKLLRREGKIFGVSHPELQGNPTSYRIP